MFFWEGHDNGRKELMPLESTYIILEGFNGIGQMESMCIPKPPWSSGSKRVPILTSASRTLS
jgi:hypothetical protein